MTLSCCPAILGWLIRRESETAGMRGCASWLARVCSCWLTEVVVLLPPLLALLLSHQDAAVPGAGSHHVMDVRADPAKLPVVGFCFSFAVEQTALNCGKLMGWTKGFDVEGVIGKDVVQLLSGACQAAGAARSSFARHLYIAELNSFAAKSARRIMQLHAIIRLVFVICVPFCVTPLIFTICLPFVLEDDQQTLAADATGWIGL